jgi:hypothetical protein
LKTAKSAHRSAGRRYRSRAVAAARCQSARSIPTGRDQSSGDLPARRQAHVTVSSHLTDGRGLFLALRRTSIWCPHDQALSRSRTAMLPGGSPTRPKLRESR